MNEAEYYNFLNEMKGRMFTFKIEGRRVSEEDFYKEVEQILRKDKKIMLTRFEVWLLNELNNARLDFRDTDPGESVDTMDAIRVRKESLEKVFNAYVQSLTLPDLQRLREEGVI